MGFRFTGLEATLQSADSYTFEGVFELGSGLEARVEGLGSVETEFADAAIGSFVSPQTSPPRPPTFEFSATVRSIDGAALWELTGTTGADSYTGLYEGSAKNLENDTTYRFELEPIGEDMPDVIGFRSTPGAVPVGEPATFSWLAFDFAGGNLTCALSPGDGSPSYSIQNCGSDAVQEHVYMDSGVWQARLEVTNSLGNTVEAHWDVDVIGTAPGTLKWGFRARDYITSAPAVGPDGRSYFGTHDGKFIALEPDGTLAWHRDFEVASRASPSIAENGTIHIDSAPYLYALDSEGGVLWRHDIGGSTASSAAIAGDGTVYVGSGDYHLYAIDRDGTLKWRYRTENSSPTVLNSRIESSPAIGADGIIYFGTEGGYFYALNPDGTLEWRYDTGLDLYSSPAIAADGTIYVGSRGWKDCFLFAFHPDGTLKWQYPIDIWASSSPVIDAGGTVYIGSDYTQGLQNSAIYAIDADGTLAWRFDAGSSVGVTSTAAIGADGTIYMAGRALDAGGDLLWNYPASGTAAFGVDETVLFSGGAVLHAVNVAIGVDAASAWPKFQQNARNAGRRVP